MSSLPSIDVVVIGLNPAKTLRACLESIKTCGYSRDKVSIIYADGGSTDGSLEIAESEGCLVVRVDAAAPTPGRQRNAGWRAGSAEYVQFLDSDTILHPQWLGKAAAAFSGEKTGAVCGNRRELHPEETLFNWLGDLEWNGPSGPAEAFGGDVLIRRTVLELTGGYDPDLIAGEDPELSYRVRREGFSILKLDEPMTSHDLAMRTVKQYWKRAYRSGHAYAEVHRRHRDFWSEESKRIAFRTVPLLAALALSPLALLSPWVLLALPVGVVLLLRPRILLTRKFQETLSLSAKDARIYGWHASLVVLPQFFGVLRYWFGRIFKRPLTNKRILPKLAGKAAR